MFFNMQYKVPQGIDMQDRILGPLSLFQFGIVLFGGLVAYFLVVKITGSWSKWLAMAVFALSVVLTFEYVRRMIISAIYFILKPRARVWHKALQSEIIAKEPPPASILEKNRGSDKEDKMKNISELAEVLDTRGKK